MVIAGLILTGLLVGALSGIFGVGGGFLLTPVLHIVFGIPYPQAVTSSLLAIPAFSALGIASHYRLGHVHFGLGAVTVLAMIPSVFLGTRVLELVKSRPEMNLILDSLYIAVILVAAILMILEYRQWAGRVPMVLEGLKLHYRMRGKSESGITIGIPALVLIAVVAGFLNGLLGVGGGFFIVPMFVTVFSLPMVVAVGTSLFVVMISSLLAAGIHALNGNVSLVPVLLVIAGGLAGTVLGSRLTPRIRGKKIRLYFLYVLAVSLLMIGLSMIFGA